MALKKSELLELLKDTADDVDVTDVLKGIEGLAEVKEVPFNALNLTIDDYKNILENNKTIQGYNQSQIDSFVSKGVESFKSGKMQEYINEAVEKAKIPPNETPEQAAIRELKEKLENIETEKAMAEKQIARNNMSKKIKNSLKEKYKDFKYDISDDILERFIGDDEESSNQQIDQLVGYVSSILKADRESYYNHNNPQPPGDGGGSNPKKMTLTEAMQYKNEHPDVDVKTLI